MPPQREPINHGSYGGAQAHRRRGEEACDDCKAAARAYAAEHRATYRRAGRDPLAQHKRQKKLRGRALSRLAEMYPEDYRRLYQEEATGS